MEGPESYAVLSSGARSAVVRCCLNGTESRRVTGRSWPATLSFFVHLLPNALHPQLLPDRFVLPFIFPYSRLSYL